MKKITLLLSVAIATLLMATGCQKTCYECQYPGQDQDGDGFPDTPDNGENGDNGNNGGYGITTYYITPLSSFETIEVDVDGYCDGYGTETWTVVKVFETEFSEGGYFVVYTSHLTESQFNFSNREYYYASVGTLDNIWSCGWNTIFDPPQDELKEWD